MYNIDVSWPKTIFESVSYRKSFSSLLTNQKLGILDMSYFAYDARQKGDREFVSQKNFRFSSNSLLRVRVKYQNLTDFGNNKGEGKSSGE